jgi:hypothetical protein
MREGWNVCNCKSTTVELLDATHYFKEWWHEQNALQVLFYNDMSFRIIMYDHIKSAHSSNRKWNMRVCSMRMPYVVTCRDMPWQVMASARKALCMATPFKARWLLVDAGLFTYFFMHTIHTFMHTFHTFVHPIHTFKNTFHNFIHIFSHLHAYFIHLYSVDRSISWEISPSTECPSTRLSRVSRCLWYPGWLPMPEQIYVNTTSYFTSTSMFSAGIWYSKTHIRLGCIN